MNRPLAIVRTILFAVFATLLPTVGRAAPPAEIARGTCRITGQVDLDGRPVAATVEVRLRAENPRFPHAFLWTAEAIERRLAAPVAEKTPVATVRSGADGTFEVGGLAPGRYWVLASTESGAWAGSQVPLDAAGQRQHASLHLRVGTERLAGRLRLRDGKPFRGFVVASRSRLWDPDRREVVEAIERWAETDAEGRFVLEGLARGEALIGALIPGKLLQTFGSVILPHAEDLDLTVDDVEHPTQGRVLDIESDEPLAGASIVWEAYTRTATACGVETTASDGTFRVPAPVRPYTFHVRKPGYAARYFQYLFAGVPPVIRLRRGVRVTGRVVTAEGGSPGAGLLVERASPGGGYQFARTTTDAEGRFTLDDQAPGASTIRSYGLGWVPSRPVKPEAIDEWTDAPQVDPFSWFVETGRDLHVTLTVTRGATIEGRIEDADGRPVAGVPVVLDGGGDPAFAWEGHGMPPSAASGADGAFRIDGLLDGGEYELHAHPVGAAPLRAKATAGPPGKSRSIARMRLPPPNWILVRVVDRRTRDVVRGARVQITIDSRQDDRSWRTGDDGVARVGPVGPYVGEVEVHADGHLTANQHAVPVATPAGTAVTVELDRALEIRGHVVWADGTPASEAIVYVAEISDDIWKTYRGKKACDAAGNFVAEAVNDIDYRIAAVAWREEERFEATAVLRGGRNDVLLTLAPAPKPVPDPAPSIGPSEERPPAARMRVLDPRGRPVPRANVDGSQHGVVDGEVLFDRKPGPDDAFEISNARADDDVPLELGPLLVKGWPAGSDAVPVVTLPLERVIEGRFVDPEGQAVPRVEVRAVRDDELAGFLGDSPHGAVVARAVARADGTFRLGRLVDREYRLEFTLPAGFLVPSATSRGRPGPPAEIRLRRGIAVPIVVHDADGRPVEGASVAASRDTWIFFFRNGWSREPTRMDVDSTDAEGRAVLRNLDPDRAHSLAIRPPSKREDVSPEDLRAWKPAPTTVTLKPRGVIRGRIEGEEGRERSQTYVLWRQGGAWQQTYRRHGPLEMTLPVRGEVELLAGPSNLRRPLATSRTVKARTGDEGVTVPYESGASLRLRTSGGPTAADAVLEWAVFEEADGRSESTGRSYRGGFKRITAEIVFDGLDPAARYTVLVVGAPGGLCGRATGVTPGADVVVVPLAVGASIRGTVTAGGLPASARVSARPVGGGPEVEGRVEGEGGRFHIDGLPPGRWKVQATAVLDDDDAEAKAEVEAGGTVELVLERR